MAATYLHGAIEANRQIGTRSKCNVAATEAAKNGVEVFSSAVDVPDNIADFIISNNALEHTLRPLDELKALLPKLKPGGLMHFRRALREHIPWNGNPGTSITTCIHGVLCVWGTFLSRLGMILLNPSPTFISGLLTILRLRRKEGIFEGLQKVWVEETSWFQVRAVARK